LDLLHKEDSSKYSAKLIKFLSGTN